MSESEFHVEVVRLGPVEKHPNADTLSITKVHGGYPVIFQTAAGYKEGDLAVYVPVDAIVPETAEWAFLGKHRTIGAKRLRGIFSMGLLTKAPEGAKEGDDVQAFLGITRYEEEEPTDPNNVKGPSGPRVPIFGINGYRRYSDALQLGEEVVITEKLHGETMRFMLSESGEFYIGSRTCWKNPAGDSRWAKHARDLNLEERLRALTVSNVVFFGELCGQVSGFDYGTAPGELTLRIFDVFDRVGQCYLDHDEARQFVAVTDLPTVPLLHRGPWNPDLLSLASGPTTMGSMVGTGHVREGIVIKTTKERSVLDPATGFVRLRRVCLKYIGEGYLLQKGKR